MKVKINYLTQAYPVELGTKGAIQVPEANSAVVVYGYWDTVVSHDWVSNMYQTLCKPTDRQVRKWKKEVRGVLYE